jgi:hypothetical protein
MFMHDGAGHLLGNMLFLWVFGLVVEGRAGPLVFSALYLGAGVFQNMVEQLAFLAIPDVPSLGASGAIFSIMVIAMIWCPQDQITFFYWFFFVFAGLVQIPILLLGAVYVFWDFGFVLFEGAILSTSVLHIVGAVTGLVLAIIGLRFNWVDCEQRDLVSMFREAGGKELAPREPRKTAREVAQEKKDIEEARESIALKWKSIDMHLAGENAPAALNVMSQIRKLNAQAVWDEPRLYQIIRIFQKQERWDEVIHYSEQYLSRFTEKYDAVALNAAKVMLLKKGFPRRVIQLLEKYGPQLRDPQSAKVAEELSRRARQRIDQGEIEPQF